MKITVIINATMITRTDTLMAVIIVDVSEDRGHVHVVGDGVNALGGSCSQTGSSVSEILTGHSESKVTTSIPLVIEAPSSTHSSI